MTPFAAVGRLKEVTALMAGLYAMAGPHRVTLMLALAGQMVVAVLDGITTVLAVDFIYVLFEGQSQTMLPLFDWVKGMGFADSVELRAFGLLALIATTLLRLLMSGTVRAWQAVVAARIATHTRLHILDNALAASFPYLDKMRTGWLREVMTSGSSSLVPITQSAITVLGTLLTLAILAALLVAISPGLTLMAMLVGAVAAPSKLFTMRRIHEYSRRSTRAKHNLMEELNEAILGVRHIKLMNMEQQFRTAVEDVSIDTESNQMRTVIFSIFEPILFHVIAFVGIAAILMASVTVELYPFEVVTAFSFVLYRAVTPAVLAGTNMSTIFKKLPQARIVMQFYYLPESARDRVDGDELPHDEIDEIRFTGVALAYGKGLPQSLQHVDFVARRGEFVAVVGSSGAGKTSLLNLLLNMYPASQGTVSIGGRDVNALKPQAIRGAIGTVSQDIHLFNMTIADLISGKNPEITRDDVIVAAKMAEAHEFILALPEGYDTPIGHRGVRFSGGQRQRLSIAQMFARNTPIIILDEATSGLDTITEQRIIETLERHKRGRILILVTHRIETTRSADRICVLEQGKVVEVGTFDDLARGKGRFSELMRRTRLEAGPL